MCQVLDRAEQRGFQIGFQKGYQIGLIRGAMRQARGDALQAREMLNITDTGLIAELVMVDRALVEQWFREKPMLPAG